MTTEQGLKRVFGLMEWEMADRWQGDPISQRKAAETLESLVRRKHYDIAEVQFSPLTKSGYN